MRLRCRYMLIKTLFVSFIIFCSVLPHSKKLFIEHVAQESTSLNNAVVQTKHYLVKHPELLRQINLTDIHNLLLQVADILDDGNYALTSYLFTVNFPCIKAQGTSDKSSLEVEVEEVMMPLFTQCHENYIAFSQAIRNKELATLQSLLAQGFIFESCMVFWLYAVHNSYERTMQFLIEAGVDVALLEAMDKAEIFYAAINKGDAQEVERLLHTNYSVQELQSYDPHPLLYATYHRKYEVIKQLVAEGVNINQQSTSGKTALMLATDAISRGNSEKIKKTIQLLVALGANVNKQDRRGWTALKHAYQEVNPVAFEELLRLGADATIKDREGKTVSDYIRHMMTKYGDKDNQLYLDLLQKYKSC